MYVDDINHISVNVTPVRPIRKQQSTSVSFLDEDVSVRVSRHVMTCDVPRTW